MSLSLCPQEVALGLDVRGKIELLDELARMAKGSRPLDAEAIGRALKRRERAGSTGIGNGLAIPHARITGIEKPLTLFVRTRSPIAFGGSAGAPVLEGAPVGLGAGVHGPAEVLAQVG